MAATKTRTRKPPARQEPIQVNVRLSQEHLDQLGAWLEEINAARGWPKLTRTDVIRNLLAKGLEERPEWMGKLPLVASSDDLNRVALWASEATAHHEAGHAVVSHALGVAVDRVTSDDFEGFARFDKRKQRVEMPHDSELIGRHVALIMAGYFAERRYLAGARSVLPAALARRAYPLEGARGDLAAIERRNPYSTVNELTGWHRAARSTWRSPDEWRSFTLAWARVSGQLVRQLWPHVEALAYELIMSEGVLQGRPLKRLLKPVPAWEGRCAWQPSWFAELLAASPVAKAS